MAHAAPAFMSSSSSDMSSATPRGGAGSITIPGRSAIHHAPPSRDISQASSLDKYAAGPASPARKLAARTFLERDNTRPELRSAHLSAEEAESSTFSELALNARVASPAGSASEDHHHHRRPEGEELAAEGERDEIGFAEAVRREREQRGDYSPIEGGTPGTPPLPHSPLATSRIPMEDLRGMDGSSSSGSSDNHGTAQITTTESAQQQDLLSSSPLRWVPQSNKVQTPPLCSSVRGLAPMSAMNDEQASAPQAQGQ